MSAENGYKVTLPYEVVDEIIVQELRTVVENGAEEKFSLAAMVLLEYYEIET